MRPCIRSVSDFKQQGESEGKAILIIGGAGGVGSLAIQLAKIAKLHVIATASRHESQAWCRKMGADEVIDHTQSIPDQLQQLHWPMVDYILNTSQIDQHWQAMCEAIKPQGVFAESSRPQNPWTSMH